MWQRSMWGEVRACLLVCQHVVLLRVEHNEWPTNCNASRELVNADGMSIFSGSIWCLWLKAYMECEATVIMNVKTTLDTWNRILGFTVSFSKHFVSKTCEKIWVKPWSTISTSEWRNVESSFVTSEKGRNPCGKLDFFPPLEGTFEGSHVYHNYRKLETELIFKGMFSFNKLM